MSNTTTAPAKTRRATPATMRAALVKAGLDKAKAAALTPKALLAAYEALTATPAPAKETPVKKQSKTPAKAAKQAPAKKAATPTAPRTPANCGCGCGQPTITAKAKFVSGHDARFAGQVGRGEIQPTDAQRDLITPALQAKIDKIAATANRKAAEKAAKAAAKAAAAKAYAEALKA